MSKGFDQLAFSRRFKLLVGAVGDEQSAALTGKSVRQLKRYSAGDEPPFGVLRRLVEASGATLDWVTFGETSCLADYQLNQRYNQDRLTEALRALKDAEEVETVLQLKEQIALLRKMIELDGRLAELAAGPKPEPIRARTLEALSDAIRHDYLSAAIEITEEWLANNQRAMHPEKKAEVVTQLYELIADDAAEGRSAVDRTKLQGVLRLVA